MAYTRQVPRGPSAVVLTFAVLVSLFMSATATFNSCTNFYQNADYESTQCCVATGICSTDTCFQNKLGFLGADCGSGRCRGVTCVPVPGCNPANGSNCLGSIACANNATSCSGISADTICFFYGTRDYKFKTCQGCVLPVNGNPRIAPNCPKPSPPPPSPPPPSPSPPSPSPFPPSPSPPSPFPPSPSPSPPPVAPGFPFCECNRRAANTPFDFTLTSVSSVPATNVTGSFRVRSCNATSNSCCSMDLNKVEFLSGDRCQGSVQAVFVNGVSRSWSWQIYGPGKFVFKVTNLALSSLPGPNYADGVVLQIVLRPGSACPSFDTFFPGRVYSVFNARKNCCPVAPLRLPAAA